ncbi:MAG: (p)ppGpp synthase/HD superfamily hydrolase [Bradymonadia bacterium]|jgi:(p)ppGpp synthase/HD superfamily hydrolase
MSELPTALVLRAAYFAARHHVDQRRKGDRRRPYINHCVQVAEMLARVADVDDAILFAGALLHDVIEDTSATEADVRAAFGDAVADLVMEVTDDKSLCKAERKRMQIATAGKKSGRARLLKIADKISNVRDLVTDAPDWPAERCLQYVMWSRDVVAPMRGVNADIEAAFDAACAATEAHYRGMISTRSS